MMVLFYLFLFIFVLFSAILSLVILVQESKSLGLGASFGGDASSSLFGTSTADVLKKFTAWMAGIFMIICLVFSLFTSSLGRYQKKQIQQTIEAPQK